MAAWLWGWREPVGLRFIVAASDLLFGAGWDEVWPKTLYAGWDLVLGGWDAVWGVAVCFVVVDLLCCAYK